MTPSLLVRVYGGLQQQEVALLEDTGGEVHTSKDVL